MSPASRGAGEHQEWPRPAVVRAGPRHGAGGEQRDAGGDVRDRFRDRHVSSELRHSPENSDLVMKPLAGVDSSRLRNAAPPRGSR